MIALLTASLRPADAGEFRTRLEAGAVLDRSASDSLDAALGFADRQTGFGSLRLMWNASAGPLQFEIHSELDYLRGDNVRHQAALAPFLPVSPPATLFDLTTRFNAGARADLSNTIDRLSVTYAGPNVVFKAGRQAITWGSGIFFRPLDIVAPFAPNAIDTGYKTGADMIYLQYLFENGADVQAIAVPRRATDGGPVTTDTSTFALHGSLTLGDLDLSFLAASDRGDTAAGAGLGGALGGAVFNVELVRWSGSGYAPSTSWLANISNSGTVLGRNTSYFAEYYHNGFGVNGQVALDALPSALVKRLATGQVFTGARDVLALGATLEITPDLILSPSAIIGFNGLSALLGVQMTYSVGDNTDLMLDLRQPAGPRGTEFGGRETAAGSGIFARPPQEVTLRLVTFF